MNQKLSFLCKLFVGVFLLSSCGGGGGGGRDVSKTTNWRYNDPDNGGFEVIHDYEQETGPGLVLVEGGTFTMGRVEEDVMYAWDNQPRRVTISSFYMDETEISNVDYREYLHWIRRVFVDYPEVYRRAVPDTLVWRRPMAYNEPYVQYYFRHPAYNDYPVVGVTWLNATDYCAWRSDRVNEGILIRQGILNPDPNQLNEENFNTEAYLAGQYEGLVNQNLPDLDPNKDTRRVRLEDGLLLPRYRLPSEAEWEYAALALIGNTFEERIYERRIYPWDGHNIRMDEARNRGEMRANYVRGKGDLMGVAGDLNDNASIPGQVQSFWPNDYGLYCMAGNVNEWVFDVYRPLSHEDVDEFNPVRGNIFKTLVKDEEGNVAEKDSLGRLRYREITEEEAINRWNYRKADYRNYQDGDYESSIIEGSDWASGARSQERSSERMYAQKVGDESSLVSDHSRVYKGGSWRDRAYWLSPGTRRFLDERQSRDDLGFRCAMTRVGSPAGN
jgi:gliding motility-associated lipoprotein GldJ